ncbi:aldehyde dehydrogenase [Microdochium trichocladiopsis]|uniref:Aldehyde dehydrogenase n=1 Tax=Microdochium trichocladiopsis TaxID=1682393 RepID=A0A9P9BNG3_9PEZI|nr:aldehyde dehydrogenase [Microdochium trichocladiopsis]KAH7027713.1 aldehyde dehydrogenase [Microdochium trichocladiopsis]
MADYIVPFVINGEQVQPKDTFDVVAPGTGKVLHKCGNADVAVVNQAVEAAAAAGKEWGRTLPSKRRDIFLKAAEVLESRREELGKFQADETGAPPGWPEFNLGNAIDMLKDIAGRVATIQGAVPTTASPDVSSMVWKEPYGVVLAMAPWNAPYILGMRAVILPIAAGCTVVFKGSELSPRVMHGIVDALHEAGLPKGVLNFITCAPSNAPVVTEALVAHSEVKKINFTGSTAVGRIIGKLAGQHLKPVVLELGGKAPAIVWEDADLDNAALQCTLGSFLYSGQICMSTERILVHKKISAAFQEKFLKAIEQVFPSSGEAPILITGQAVDKTKKLVKDATDKGAAVVGNGSIETEEASKTRLRPIVVTKVTPEMDLYKTESFGPAVSIIEVETEEEALRIANDTEYGLSSAVFTEDLRTGLRFAKGIEVGAVHINNMTVHDESALPHGGVKSSGYGRFNASWGLDEWTRTKTVTWKN